MHPEICPCCHRPSLNFRTCSACKKEAHRALEGVVIGFAYQELIKKLVLKIKFYHKYDGIEGIIQSISFLVQTLPELATQQTIITYVPAHWKRTYREKGYNQSEILAKELANQLSFPMIPVAKKIRYTRSQVKLSKKEREKNLKNAFIPLNLNQIPWGTTLLLVDDILTTGTTLNSLAQTIKTPRPDLKIRGVVVARNMK